jgi:stearoyl-CoA desaturase (delta-9 desaturase)
MGNVSSKGSMDLKSLIVLTLTPVVSIVFIPYYAVNYGFSLSDWLWFSFFMVSTGLSITAGYHRLWSHRAYKANSILKVFFMLFGAAALQNSIIKWSSDHRDHHRFVDNKELDPYAATKGFWYSHFTWMLRDSPNNCSRTENITDLKKDKIVMFQDRYYAIIAIFMCFGLPGIIGAVYGSIGGCLLLSGFLRLVLNHHFTFFINSLAHIWGKQLYSDETTARDNPILSLFTYGEGYHNFHHKYAGDYRNGVKWYDFDPSKWVIYLLSKIGCTYDMKTIPKPMIEAAKASMQLKYTQVNLDKKRSEGHYVKGIIDSEARRLELQYKTLFESIRAWAKASQECLKAQKEKQSPGRLIKLKARYKYLSREFKLERKIWKSVVSGSSKYTQVVSKVA